MSKMIVGAAVALALSLPALAAVQKPYPEGGAPALRAEAFPNLTLIYVASGVRDNAGATRQGVATVAHCTNFSASAQRIQFIVRAYEGSVKANKTVPVSARGTHTATTKDTALFDEDSWLNTGHVNQGSLLILSTSPQVTCSAHLVYAGAVVPYAADLHLVRFNSWPGTQE